MTDITELAQREKFEAWWERTQHNGNPPRFGWSHWRDGEGYKVDDDNSELDGMWSAWKAAVDELVEALEKAQTKANVYDMLREDYGLREKGVGLADFVDWQANRIAELDAELEREREKSRRVMSHIAELESRTVTVKPMRPGHITVGGEKIGIYMRDEVDEFIAALAAAGIKVEAE